MNFIWDKITEWLKDLLVSGIVSNLSGLFDSINTRVADVASTVGKTPQAWNGSIFNMIRSLSENVVVPIAGIILTFVMCLELIQLLIDRNNMHDFDTFIFVKWIIKTFAAVLIVTNTWNIVMGVFDVAQHVVSQAAGVIIGETALDVASLLGDMEATLMEMDVGPLFGLWFQSSLMGDYRLGAEHLYLHHRLWPHDRNLYGHIRRAHPYGHHGQPGMGSDGTELSAVSVCPGLSGIPHHGVRRHLCCAGTEHLCRQ